MWKGAENLHKTELYHKVKVEIFILLFNGFSLNLHSYNRKVSK